MRGARTGAQISPRQQATFTFIVPGGFGHPKTRTHVRLLGPCFKTGRMKPYDRQRLRRVCATLHREDTEVPVHCTQSTVVTAHALRRGQPIQHAPQTPLSDPSRLPKTITQAEACYLSPERLPRFEHSLTRHSEKCVVPRAERAADSPSDLHNGPTALETSESPSHLANSMRFPPNGFTYC